MAPPLPSAMEHAIGERGTTMMDIGVTVDEGVVTLTGTVTSRAERRAALEATRRVSGVQDVANRIKVALPPRGTGGRPRRNTAMCRDPLSA
jgi:BON domain